MDTLDFRRHFDLWADQLQLIRQNRLLSEDEFVFFIRRCGLAEIVDASSGGIERWAFPDGKIHDGRASFHPFRLFAVCEARVGSGAEGATTANRVVDLAVLLEPLYWPEITGRCSLNGGIGQDTYVNSRESHRAALLKVIKTLDLAAWRHHHEALCAIGHCIDPNRELYLLLRLSDWQRREQLEGKVAGALWIRHIAEVIRRGFEEAHGELWPEEDQSFRNGRRRVFGSERLLDTPAESRRHIARRFGLFSGSAVRWYLKGPTEYFAVLEVLGEPGLYGVELLNLAGKIAADRDNIAVNLREWLTEDNKLKRFSIVTFDVDVMPNQKTIRRLADLITGSVFANEPDFEFANFTLLELVSVAASLDEQDGLPGRPVREADWDGIGKGGDFEKKYAAVSESHRSLKGEKWGRALARYAELHPGRADGRPRPFRDALMHATLAQSSNYDNDRETYRIDPETYQRVPRGAHARDTA
jgi:hypothetical protein